MNKALSWGCKCIPELQSTFKMKERELYPSPFSFFIFFFLFHGSPQNFVASQKPTTTIAVGVVLDLETSVGRMSMPSLSLALEDFYVSNPNYGTRLKLLFRDSKNDVLVAASQALDLINNEHVQAIIGPLRSSQAEFLVNLGNKTRVPIVSFSASSPSISPSQVPYFVRTTLDDSVQVKCLASIIKLYGWRDVVPIYEDTRYGNGIIPYLVDAIEEIDGRIPYRSTIQPTFSDDQIKQELYKLKTMSTRVFIVHMSSILGARFFQIANQLEMVDDDYVWILTDGITDMIDSLDFSILEKMQGVVGVRPYVEKSIELENFTRRWRSMYWKMNPEEMAADPTIYSLRAYDTLWAIAMAAERLDLSKLGFKTTEIGSNSTNLGVLDVSNLGEDFLRFIMDVRFKGLAGEFLLVKGEIPSSVFQIINVNGKAAREVGLWKEGGEIYRRNKNSTGQLPILWPGERNSAPKGWVIPTSGRKLRIVVPVKHGFREFVNVERDIKNNQTKITGFCIDVFDAVMKNMPYSVPYEYVTDENPNISYNELVNKVVEQEYDAVVGDVTILANRSKNVDFTFPFTESGWTMIVEVKRNNKNGWIFIKPWKKDLWIASFLFFVFTGFVVWMIEHRVNPAFRGSPQQHLGRSCYFTFSMMVFSHRENVMSNLSRIVIVVWIFAVLILQSSFTANLASLLTVQKLKPEFTDVHELLTSGQNVGYQKGSFIYGHLRNMGFEDSRIKKYENPDDYAQALYNGTANGGVAAIFDEIPYINVFLSKYCADFVTAGPVYKADGLGFVFPMRSPLVRDVSSSILTTSEGEEMRKIEKTWFENKDTCSTEATQFSSSRLSLQSFKGLFYITGAVSLTCLVLFIVNVCYSSRGTIEHEVREDSVVKRVASTLSAFAKQLDKRDIAGARAFDQSIGNTSSRNESHRGDIELGVPSSANNQYARG